MIQVGEKAPAFDATTGDGSPAVLDTWLGAGPVVLYFYPKDFTPG